jgi:ribosomal protein S18 acetylase RimI-like enzyme
VEATASAFERLSLDRQWFDTKITAPGYSLDWDFSVIAPEGKHVAFCLAWIDLNNRIAEIDPVGTRAGYRRRGFAKAVVSECFRQLRSVGLDYAYIGSGPEPCPSNRLYESLHPVARFQMNMWVKRLKPDRHGGMTR